MEIYPCIKFRLPQCFSLSAFVLLEVVCCFPRNKLFTFIGSQSFISPPSFMFVSAAVSEMCELNQNKKKEKKNSEIDYFQFNTFPGL